MTISIRQITATFAGDVTCVDITQPLSHQDVAAIDAGMDRHAVLVFHDQCLTDDAQRAFTRNFGALEASPGGRRACAGRPFGTLLYQPPLLGTYRTQRSNPVMAGPRPGHRLPAPNCERCNPSQQPSDGDDRVKPGRDGIESLRAVRQQQGRLV